MGEKEHFLLDCFYAQHSLGVSNTGESEKNPAEPGSENIIFMGNKMLLTCYIKDPPFQGMLCV